jgi:hypothetical protein
VSEVVDSQAKPDFLLLSPELEGCDSIKYHVLLRVKGGAESLNWISTASKNCLYPSREQHTHSDSVWHTHPLSSF